MQIVLKKLISPTKLEEYIFRIYGEKSIACEGKFTSHRNDENDVFGTDWSDFYKVPREAELGELVNSEEYYDAPDWEADRMYRDISNKYCPVSHKTKDGFPYYSGSIGGLTRYEIPWSDEDVKLLLIDKITQAIMNTKIKS